MEIHTVIFAQSSCLLNLQVHEMPQILIDRRSGTQDQRRNIYRDAVLRHDDWILQSRTLALLAEASGRDKWCRPF